MKRTALVLAGIVLLAAGARAQVSLGWGLHGNYARLDVGGQLSSVYGNGLGGGLHLDVDLMMITLRFSGDYVTFAPDEDKYRSELARLLGSAAPGFSIEGGKINILSVNANVKWALLPLPVVSPYLTGGIGLAQLSSGDLTVKYNGSPVGNVPKVDAETKTAVNVGAGVDLKLGGIALFAEAKYTWILTEGDKTGYIPITVGITF
jgi:opacity protein-like surface antigen